MINSAPYLEHLQLKHCIKIGYFQKSRGTVGKLLLNYFPEWKRSLENTKTLLTEINGLPVPWFIAKKGLEITSADTALVDLDWIKDEKAAKKLCGKNVYIDKNDIHISSDKESPAKWKDFSIFEQSAGYLGIVTAENNYSGNIVLNVDTPQGTRLIPFHENFVKRVDEKMKELTLKLPEGLLDL